MALFGMLVLISADSNWAHEIKRCFLLGRKAMTSLDYILKSRDITLPAKVHMVKAMVFPVVVMYRCESWIIKKVELLRLDAFELWCWRRLLRVPCTTRRSNQSILKEISPEYSLRGLILKLNLQYFGNLMQRTDSFEKTLMLGKIEGKRRRGRWLNGHQFSSVQSFSSVRLFVTPWTSAPQASVELAQIHVHWVCDAIQHLILCCPLLLLPSMFPCIGSFPVSWLFASGIQKIGA